MSFSTTYRANGKLLLTGEYLVLHGAKAIALPLKVGQQLTISEGNGTDLLNWQAFTDEKTWFSCKLNPIDFSVITAGHPEKSEILSRIFKTIKRLNPKFAPQAGTKFETTLESSPDWGLGSSSTLISLLAQWAGVNPFKLNELVFQGSGFDIACATADGPILYIRNKPAEPVNLDYPFSEQLFLVYSGRKKRTAIEINTFLKERKVSEHRVDEVSALSAEFAECRNLEIFNQLIIQHEQLVGDLIRQKPVKQLFFADFDGVVKSLGAWGGDFLLASTNKLTFDQVRKYFENKGLTTVFKWNDLILKRR